MPFQKGQSGNPSGRPSGTKNKPTLKIEEELQKGNCNPIQGMIDMINDETTEPSIKAKLYCELACYIYPKRKAIEHTGFDGAPINNKYTVEIVDAPRRDNKDNIVDVPVNGQDDNKEVITH